MVIRNTKRNRKYFGTRRWGVGNIKNARGAGDRGGVGEPGRLTKHDWTYITAKRRDLIRKKGFTSRNRKELKEINLTQISQMLKQSKGQELELYNYKVLSNGALEKAATIKAAAFSKQAIEKIKTAGGSIVILQQKEKATQVQRPQQPQAQQQQKQ
jgi:large subunit ribosomal protein L15